MTTLFSRFSAVESCIVYSRNRRPLQGSPACGERVLDLRRTAHCCCAYRLLQRAAVCSRTKMMAHAATSSLIFTKTTKLPYIAIFGTFASTSKRPYILIRHAGHCSSLQPDYDRLRLSCDSTAVRLLLDYDEVPRLKLEIIYTFNTYCWLIRLLHWFYLM